VGDRADCVPGDFFDSVPDAADAYLVCRVLHDWSDADAARILATCRRAVRPDSRLLVVDAVLPERAHDAPAVIRIVTSCSSKPDAASNVRNSCWVRSRAPKSNNMWRSCV
jgi:O-methyltransferase domain